MICLIHDSLPCLFIIIYRYTHSLCCFDSFRLCPCSSHLQPPATEDAYFVPLSIVSQHSFKSPNHYFQANILTTGSTNKQLSQLTWLWPFFDSPTAIRQTYDFRNSIPSSYSLEFKIVLRDFRVMPAFWKKNSWLIQITFYLNFHINSASTAAALLTKQHHCASCSTLFSFMVHPSIGARTPTWNRFDPVRLRIFQISLVIKFILFYSAGRWLRVAGAFVVFSNWLSTTFSPYWAHAFIFSLPHNTMTTMRYFSCRIHLLNQLLMAQWFQSFFVWWWSYFVSGLSLSIIRFGSTCFSFSFKSHTSRMLNVLNLEVLFRVASLSLSLSLL